MVDRSSAEVDASESGDTPRGERDRLLTTLVAPVRAGSVAVVVSEIAVSRANRVRVDGAVVVVGTSLICARSVLSWCVNRELHSVM